MKSILEVTNDELFFSLPLNKAVVIDISCQPERIVEDEMRDGEFSYSINHYITEVSEDYFKLINFIQEGKSAAYGICPQCKKPINFEVTSNIVLPSNICEREIQRYNDWNMDDLAEYLPDVEKVMDKNVRELIKHSKYIDKYIKCSLCGNIYRVSFALEYNCDRNEVKLIKIGQYPALFMFSEKKSNLFDKILNILDIKEDYRAAERMHIEDYNIAAYVYLRRILEKIVLSKYNQNKDVIDAKVQEAIDNPKNSDKLKSRNSEEFVHLDFGEKIKILKGFIPDFLLDNPEIYSIVSAGIHALEENKCKEYYDTLKQSIDIILNEEETERKRKALFASTKQGIQKAVSEIKADNR